MVPRVNKGGASPCGVCVDTCPGVFRFDDDTRAEVYDPQGADAAAIQEAIDLCPVACIYWDEEAMTLSFRRRRATATSCRPTTP